MQPRRRRPIFLKTLCLVAAILAIWQPVAMAMDDPHLSAADRAVRSQRTGAAAHVPVRTGITLLALTMMLMGTVFIVAALPIRAAAARGNE